MRAQGAISEEEYNNIADIEVSAYDNDEATKALALLKKYGYTIDYRLELLARLCGEKSFIDFLNYCVRWDSILADGHIFYIVKDGKPWGTFTILTKKDIK